MRRPPLTEEMLRARIAKNIRALRKKHGLPLKRIADRAEMHWRYWQKIEQGKVTVTVLTIVRIAYVLNIEPPDLIDA
jgi:transcriptional regulator with XRE-family HTH domain